MVAPADGRKRFSIVRYWRYIFTPILLITVIFGLYMLFTASDAQTAAYTTLVKRTNVSLGGPTAPVMSMGILQNLQRLGPNPSAL